MSDLPFTFRLRPELLGDGANLQDPLTQASYPLDGVWRTIVAETGTPAERESLIFRVIARCGASHAQVEGKLRQMMLLGLFEGCCATSRAQIERIRGGAPLEARVLEGSRFGCQSSGACCRGYVFGAISPQERARIEALGPRDALPGLGTEPLFVEAGSSMGKPTYRLATVGDACVFLEQGRRCGLHRAFGATAKPALCQLYPLSAVATIDGLKVYDRGECATFAVSATTGTLLQEGLPRIRKLVDETLYHPVVRIHRSWRCDYGLILALARRLDLEARSRPALEALHAIGHMARGFISALVRCPLEAAQPQTAAARALERAAEYFRPAEPAVTENARAGLRALAAIADALIGRVVPREAFASRFIRAASLLAETCRAALGERDLSDGARRALAVDPRNCDLVIRLSLRQLIFGRELLLDDALPAGLLRAALIVALTLAGARLLCIEDGRDTIAPHHVSMSHMIAKRTLNRTEPHRLLGANGEQAWCVLDAMPWLDRPSI